MEKRGIIVAFALILVLVLGLAGAASAATLNFQATDPNDTTNADFDITAFGATPSGDKIDFWIQVRGNINTNPEDGYLNAYVIDIYSTQDYEIAGIWINYGGSIQSIAWVSVGDNSNYLSTDDYTISGNKITFHIDSALFSDLGDEYQLIVTTVHIESSTPTLSGTHTDQAEYDYNPQSGGSSGGGENNEGPSTEEVATFALLAGVGSVVCGIVWFVIWLLIGIWAYKDAKKKCMDSPIIWFLVVFFLGIIGLIIYIVIRKDKCQPEQMAQVPPPPS